MKTSELTGAALDWAVATIAGLPLRLDPMGFGRQSPGGYWVWPDGFPPAEPGYQQVGKAYSPSTHWAQGGPIIERERIHLRPNQSDSKHKAFVIIRPHGLAHRHDGPTPLIAAMRCYVASKLGDDVDVPKELQ